VWRALFYTFWKCGFSTITFLNQFFLLKSEGYNRQMDIIIVEEETSRLLFEVDGMTHTLANALKFELRNDDNVKIVGYQISHPLVGKPRFVIETKKGSNARKSVEAAVKRLTSTFDEVGKKAKVLK